MSRLIDTNVILRVLLFDTTNSKYPLAISEMKEGGCIRPYVTPEVAYQYLYFAKRKLARKDAEAKGELAAFNEDTRRYIREFHPPAGWRKEAYDALENALGLLLRDYPAIYFEDPELVFTALSIAQSTGHDWVDCLLLAEHKLGRGVPVSLDKDIIRALSAASGKEASSTAPSTAASKGVSKMNLT